MTRRTRRPPQPTGTVASTAGPTLANSQAIAQSYFADLNSKNRTDARTLICDDAKTDFDQTANSPDNDFSFTWSNINYRAVGAVDTDVTVLTYDTTLTKGGQSEDFTVLLYFVTESGTKLCGESTN